MTVRPLQRENSIIRLVSFLLGEEKEEKNVTRYDASVKVLS